MNKPDKCPECDGSVVMVEYARGNKFRYDGVSEYRCVTGDWRTGRWCGEVLTAGMVEPPFCDGSGHPRIFDIDQPNETELNRPVQEED